MYRSALTVAITLGLLASCGPAPADRLSVVLVTLDTTRADRIGAFGGTAVPTPHLDAAGAEGAVFEQAFSQVPLTLPSHASILSGRYPATHGVRHNGLYRLPDDETTLAEILGAEGFDTAAFVAAYVVNRGYGLEQGFDRYDDVPIDPSLDPQRQMFRAQRNADEVNRAVFAWLDGRKDERFFLWVHYFDPHHPYEPPEDTGRVLHGEGYDREISFLDHGFGDLVAKLRERGVLDRSILVVAGDHGEMLGEHQEKTHGIFLYEGAVRVPLIVRAPGRVPPGTRVGGPVELVDIAPTVLDLLGVDVPVSMQGRSLMPRVRGEDDGAAALAHAESLMPRIEYGWSELRMVRSGRFKYVEAPTAELYDVRDDPGEAENLAPLEPERAAEMSALVDEWKASTASRPGGGDASRTLSTQEEVMLRSLGYLGGDAYRTGTDAGTLPDPKDRIGEVRRLVDARDALAKGDLAGGLAILDDILARNPGNHQARFQRAEALAAAGRLDAAVDDVLQALAAAEAPDEASPALAVRARLLLADLETRRGRKAEAEAIYRRVLEADAAHDDAAASLASLLHGSGRNEEASSLLGAVLARSPSHGPALLLRFRMAESGGDREAVVRAAADLAAVRYGDAAALAAAGTVLLEAGDAARAADCFQTALDRTNRLDPALLGQLGVSKLRAGDLEAAGQAFAALAAIRPSDPRAPFYLGEIARQRGDAAAARENYRQALSRSPSFAPAREALERLGDR